MADEILHEYAPEQTPALIEIVVEQIDAIVRPVRGTGWQKRRPGDRKFRRQLRLVLANNGLTAGAELYDRATPTSQSTTSARLQEPADGCGGRLGRGLVAAAEAAVRDG